MENLNRARIEKIVEKQRDFFHTNKTLDVEFRIRQLKRLKRAVMMNEDELLQALSDDLGRDRMEGYFCDVGSLILEINETIKGLKKWAYYKRHPIRNFVNLGYDTRKTLNAAKMCLRSCPFF